MSNPNGTSAPTGARSSISQRNRRPPAVSASASSQMDQQFGSMQITPGNPPKGGFIPPETPPVAMYGGQPMTQPQVAPAPFSVPPPSQGHQQYQQPHQHQGPPLPNPQYQQPVSGYPKSPAHPVASSVPPRTVQAGTGLPYQAPSTSANTRKLDPRSLPSPAPGLVNPHKVMFTTSSFGNPPPAHSKYIVNERSNCSPRYMRSTFSQVPTSQSVLNQANIPFALVVQPFAEPGHEEEEVPIVDMGVNGPIRCRRCSAYINPFVKFLDNGRYYACPLCSTQNEVPSEYFSPIEANGFRRDISERPELWRGSIDFVATSDFITRSPEHSESPIILFLIDVSASALNSGLLRAFVNSIKQILELDFIENENTQFGFITYDKSVQFWRLDPQLQVVVVPHVQHVFQPMPPSCFLANYATQKHLVDAWISEVLNMYTSSTVQDSCFGAAVNAAMLALGKRGGRIVAFQSSLANFGPGALKTREDISMYGKDTEKQLYKPQSKFYTQLAEQCAKRLISVDLFVCPQNGFTDLATISDLSKLTGGQIAYIPGFSIAQHEEKLFYDIRRSLIRRHGSEAIGRLRTSEGIVVDSYSGHFLPGEGDIEMAGIDSDQTIMVNLKHDGTIDEKQDAVVQWAMVHTNEVGQRLIRVHTLAMHTSSRVANIFRSADMETVLDVLLRGAINELGNKSIAELRTLITGKTASMLASYRKHCTKTDKGDSQLILPEALKLLPIHVLGAIKNILLSNPPGSKDGIHSIADSRIFMAHLLQTASLEIVAPLFYPRIYSISKLHNLLEVERLKAQNREQDEEEAESSSSSSENEIPLPGDEDFYGSYWLPRLIRASASELEQGGVYLMDDGQSIYLAVHPPMDTAITSRLFNEQGQLAYNEEDDLNSRVFKMIQAIRFRRPSYQQVYLFDTSVNLPHRRIFFSRLVEDGSDDYMNKEHIANLYTLGYSGFLCHVHRSVQDKI